LSYRRRESLSRDVNLNMKRKLGLYCVVIKMIITIGTWLVVGLKYSSTVHTAKEHEKAHEEQRSIHTKLGKTKNPAMD